ncbi:chromosomal replication initiator, DnaA [Hyphomicrobium denitrificans 1NES1]|uniref:Chromosomal replication initiator, DnaA n=1 Tax=Hyphomicrobium denitrificans 1NES1 TaxID=670307 RepID=N0B6J9_9HYPH|nr:DnaA/Hda family protein [Hyphomicrobium denitrificans]AGK59224.1 chromosomal replication initiator, DnaA [Hyphomicrobium denitrificans 1NES1]
MPTMPEQLVFELPHRAAMGLEDFLVSDSNAAAVALIDRWPDWPISAAILVGPKGSGKTHLANVWQLRAAATAYSASSLARESVPAVASAGAVIIENIETLSDEAALFHLLNLVREQRLQVLLTTDTAPGDLKIALPDLHSRLKALPLASIEAPDDALLRAVLVKLFADRQLSVEPHIVDYVLVRMERSMLAAERFVAEADRQALVLQRRVTRTIAAGALDTLGY